MHFVYNGMGRAGRVLKQILEKYDISQYSLATALNIERTNVYRWVHEQRDPTSETVVEIVTVLRQLNPEAAQEFVKLYLGSIAQGETD
jgi:plasmid maintenance system antidote protein VapI